MRQRRAIPDLLDHCGQVAEYPSLVVEYLSLVVEYLSLFISLFAAGAGSAACFVRRFIVPLHAQSDFEVNPEALVQDRVDVACRCVWYTHTSRKRP